MEGMVGTDSQVKQSKKVGEMDRNRIEVYAAGGAELVKAYWGLSATQLHAKPADGSWSLHQIAIHMYDSDLIAGDRMKRIAAMNRPLLCDYDETAFIELPGTDELSPFLACELFQKNRFMVATILRRLPDSAFDRVGIHTHDGAYTLGTMVNRYISHLDHHLKFIAKKRAWVEGKTLDPTLPVPASV